MIKEPMFISAKTHRNYEEYRLSVARAEGWNEAMRFIFAEELEEKRVADIRNEFYIVKRHGKTENEY